MLVERVARAADGTAVEFARDRHRGDRARFVVTRRGRDCVQLAEALCARRSAPPARSRWRAGSPTATSARARRPRVRRAPARQGHRAARHRPRGGARGHAGGRGIGVGPAGRLPARAGVPRHRVHRRAPGDAGRAARAGSRRGRGARCARIHAGPALPVALRRRSPCAEPTARRRAARRRDPAPPGYDEVARGARADPRGARRPSTPGAVPQRPADRELPPRRRARCGSSTGSTPGMGDPLLRPRQPRRPTTASTRPTTSGLLRRLLRRAGDAAAGSPPCA